MEPGNKRKVYFDYNIYDAIEKQRLELYDAFHEENVAYISVAHIEEFYNAIMNDIHVDTNEKPVSFQLLLRLAEKSSNWIHNEKILFEMKALSEGVILNPGNDVIAKKESIEECLKRVYDYDTRKMVERNGKNLYQLEKESISTLTKNNPSVKNYSNESPDAIWEEKEMEQLVLDYPQHAKVYEQAGLRDLFENYGWEGILMAKKIKNFDANYIIEKNCMKHALPSFGTLECIMEYLNQGLCARGYNRDGNVEKTQSGIHDTSHLIYATYCEKFYTLDKRLGKRAGAIYRYLGIPTEVVYGNENVILHIGKNSKVG